MRKKMVHLDNTGGLKSSNCVLDALQISLKADSPFSDLITSNVLSRSSYPNPVCRRWPGCSPPCRIRCPVSFREITFSLINLPKMWPRNTAAFGASVTSFSKVAKTDSNLLRERLLKAKTRMIIEKELAAYPSTSCLAFSTTLDFVRLIRSRARRSLSLSFLWNESFTHIDNIIGRKLGEFNSPMRRTTSSSSTALEPENHTLYL